MNSRIISIGDELLIGQVVNTNAAWLGARLTEHGYEVDSIVVVGDDRVAIRAAIEGACGQPGVVFVSGGLGPTHDDVTREAVCDLLDCELVEHAAQLERIERRFAARGIEVNERSRRQALVPAGARAIENEHGSAPALEFDFDQATVYVLPGVPHELMGIVDDVVMPRLIEHAGDVESRTFLVFGPTESSLAHSLEDFSRDLDRHVTLAFLPAFGGIRLRLMRRGGDSDAHDRYVELERGIRERVESNLVSDDGATLAEAVGRLLRERRYTVAVAESCTGGLLGAMLTDVPGSSEYFTGGIISYDNRVKVTDLGVNSEVLDREGAVSEHVAREMAIGVRLRLETTFGVAITGIAGPGGGTEAKPVGTVWIAVAGPSDVTVRVFNLGDRRSVVRERAACIALDMLRRMAGTL